MPGDKNPIFAERNDNGDKVTRQHDSVPVKRRRKVTVDSPRMTERDAFDRAAYGDGAVETETPDERETAIYRTGAFAYCVKCSRRYPATAEYFRRDASRKRGIQHLCLTCNRSMSRDRMANNRISMAFQRTGKFKRR